MTWHSTHDITYSFQDTLPRIRSYCVEYIRALLVCTLYFLFYFCDAYLTDLLLILSIRSCPVYLLVSTLYLKLRREFFIIFRVCILTLP